MDQKQLDAKNPESNLNRINSTDVNEDDYFRASNSVTNGEHEIPHKKIFESKVNIEFPTERVFKKSEFEILGLLGRGAYAKVVKAKLIQDNAIYAIKIIDKSFIEKVNFDC